MDFYAAFKRLIGHEGGFTDDPRDNGNWTGGKRGVGELKGTKYGISAASYPDLDIAALTLGDAQALYLRDFWNLMMLDGFPEQIRFDLFDTGVNAGPERAVKLLQAAVGLDQSGTINDALIKRAVATQGDLLDKRFNGQRLLWLTTLKNWPVYAKGWVRRIARNLIED